jgi:hypothetical protein
LAHSNAPKGQKLIAQRQGSLRPPPRVKPSSEKLFPSPPVWRRGLGRGGAFQSDSVLRHRTSRRLSNASHNVAATARTLRPECQIKFGTNKICPCRRVVRSLMLISRPLCLDGCQSVEISDACPDVKLLRRPASYVQEINDKVSGQNRGQYSKKNCCTCARIATPTACHSRCCCLLLHSDLCNRNRATPLCAFIKLLQHRRCGRE